MTILRQQNAAHKERRTFAWRRLVPHFLTRKIDPHNAVVATVTEATMHDPGAHNSALIEVQKVVGIGWRIFVTLPKGQRKAIMLAQSLADANDEAHRLHRLAMAFWRFRPAGEKPLLVLGQEDDA